MIGTLNWEIEDDQGESPIPYSYMYVTLHFEFVEGEPMVMYYPDGTGHPGSPDEVYIYDLQVDKVRDLNGIRKPTDKENQEVQSWYLAKINSDDALYERIREDVIEYVEELGQPYEYE